MSHKKPQLCIGIQGNISDNGRMHLPIQCFHMAENLLKFTLICKLTKFMSICTDQKLTHYISTSGQLLALNKIVFHCNLTAQYIR